MPPVMPARKERKSKMNKTYSMIALLVLIGSLAMTAQGQTNNRKLVEASIPFEFNVGDRTMAAGEYTIRLVSPHSEPSVLQILDAKGDAVMLLRTQVRSGAAAKKSVLL